MKEYKASIFYVVRDFIAGVLGIAFVYWLCLSFLENPLAIYGITLALAFAYFYLVLLGSRIYIRVDQNELYIKQSKKEYRFYLDQVEVSAKSTNQGELDLYIQHAEGTLDVDCSFLGYAKFEDLLETLGVIGDKQKAIKLETKK